ncbi:amidohydrolase [Pseudoxanthomonas sp. PXM01]|uniref:amidohydrolase n=1 Tax=Pseudoxanthomonas sp. PXM01 TaxID=2769295 RepID=UPI0017875F25|nr:amidohydrolase [Pseudoxanthomonas sp. PXM01]MBD9468626.1 amidohydrolase [Pseudoxanthomonas sp. PXM01]
MRRLALGMGGLLVCAGVAQAQVQVVTAARVHTSDPAQPVAEAMAWDAQGRILAVGGTRDLLARYPGAKRIDATGKTVIPGLIDAHGHVMGLGYALMRADLVDAQDKAEVVARLREFEKQLPPNAWLLGGGWDQNDWPGKTFPTAADLDAAFPDRPVWLERVDGHAGWANSAALRAVASRATRSMDGAWQPEGGRIERVDGKPSGVFVDAAMALVNAVVPAPDAAYRRQALEKATQAAVRNGLTGVHDMGVSREDLALMRQFADEGRLPLRIDAYADGDGAALGDLCATGPYHHAGGRLQMTGVKLYADGALGSRGAALLEDYSDDPGNRGLLVTEPAALESAMRKARDCKVQVATHAIGDRGNRLVLDAYQRVLGDAAKTDHRWRIEHAQVVAPEEFPRFAALGIVASMQPTHATSDMPWAQDRLGPVRITGAYAWQRLQESGVKLALGSDFPVESVDPRRGLHAAVTRQDGKDHPGGGWMPDQRLSAAEALRGFTADAAWAGHDESEVGRLAPGLRADFVILDEDPLAIPGEQLDDLHVRSTWVDGKQVYSATSDD